MNAVTEQAHRRAVAAVLRVVREQPDGSLATLADLACLSPFHFHRVFRRLTGRTPAVHLRSVRLVRAAIALRTGREPIVAVALASGYENHESFSRAFRKAFGCAPSEYRGRHAAPPGGRVKDLNPAVQLVKVSVTDFGRARRFYRDVLGLAEEFAVEEYGWAQYAAGDVPVCVYVVGRGGGDGTPGGEAGFHLAVDDASVAHARVKAAGAALPCDLVSSDDGGRFFVVADPDGNRIKVCQRT